MFLKHQNLGMSILSKKNWFQEIAKVLVEATFSPVLLCSFRIDTHQTRAALQIAELVKAFEAELVPLALGLLQKPWLVQRVQLFAELHRFGVCLLYKAALLFQLLALFVLY